MWVLIVVALTAGATSTGSTQARNEPNVSVAMQEFSSKERCDAAAQLISNNGFGEPFNSPPGLKLTIRCVEK